MKEKILEKQQKIQLLLNFYSNLHAIIDNEMYKI